MVRVLAHYPVQYLQDKTSGIKTGDLVVFACGSGTGKSTFARLITFSAIEQGQPVAVYSLEDKPGTFWKDYERLLFIADRGVNMDFISYELADSEQPKEFEKYRRKAYEMKCKKNKDGLPMLDLNEPDPDNPWDIKRLQESITEQVQRGYKIIVLDHLDAVGDESVLSTQTLMGCLWNIIIKYDIAIVTFSQLVKDLPEKILCPGMNHLRGSYAKTLKSTLVVTMARDFYRYYTLPGQPNAVANYMRITKQRGRTANAAIVFYENGNYLAGYREVLCNASGTFIDGMTQEKLQKTMN